MNALSCNSISLQLKPSPWNANASLEEPTTVAQHLYIVCFKTRPPSLQSRTNFLFAHPWTHAAELTGWCKLAAGPASRAHVCACTNGRGKDYWCAGCLFGTSDTNLAQGTVCGSASSKLSQPVSKLPCDHDTFTRATKIEEAWEGRGAKKALLKATRSKKSKSQKFKTFWITRICV